MNGMQIQKSAKDFLRDARAATGIDIDDFSVEEPLERLLQALNTEACLNDRGASAMNLRIQRILCNRLRMKRDIAANPGISAQRIDKPVFLTGGPRTGSTKLHKLLAATGDFKFLPFWRGHSLSLRTGDRNEDPAVRISEAKDYVAWITEFAPEAQRNHDYGIFEPEEESLILEHFICSTFPNVFAHVPSFMAWRMGQDFTEEAKFLKQGLQYLQWQFHDGDTRPWVLKCPIYPGFEHLLESVFPGAAFITTNRHPLNSVASTANLVQGYRQAYSDVDRRRALAEIFLEGLAMAMSQQLALHDSHPDLRILDVGYGKLTRSSESVVHAIYRYLDIAFSENAKKSVSQWEASYRHDGQSRAKYTLADFGLTEQAISDRFKDYIAHFEKLF